MKNNSLLNKIMHIIQHSKTSGKHTRIFDIVKIKKKNVLICCDEYLLNTNRFISFPLNRLFMALLYFYWVTYPMIVLPSELSPLQYMTQM